MVQISIVSTSCSGSCRVLPGAGFVNHVDNKSKERIVVDLREAFLQQVATSEEKR